MRAFLGTVFLIVLAGCGGGGGASGDSFTAKAFDEFRAGNGADAYEKRKPPTKAEIAAVQKRMQAFAPRSKSDLYQALWILSNQREHEELHFNTMAKSTYVAEAYKRVFGPLENANTREEPNTWSHSCTDGKVTLRGNLKLKGQPGLMAMYPPKPK